VITQVPEVIQSALRNSDENSGTTYLLIKHGQPFDFSLE